MLRYRQGFTLLEVLIAVTLSAMVMLTLTVGINIVVKDWERSSNQLEDNLEVGLIALQLERALEGSFPHVYFDRDDNQRHLFFEGTEDELSFVSTVSPGRQPGLTAWQLKPAKDKPGIEIRVVSAFASDPSENLKKTDPITAFEGYKAFFEYLYFDEQFKTDTKWLDEWSAKKLQGLPNAVRLRLEKDTGRVDESLEIIAVIEANDHQSFRRIKP